MATWTPTKTTDLLDVSPAAPAAGQALVWDATAGRWAPGSGSGVGAESDPVFAASAAHAITTADVFYWNTAYGWGNHAAAGYALDAAVVHTAGAETIAGIKTFTAAIVGSITGNAGTATNGVVTTGSYADPPWITSLSASKLGPVTAVGTTTARTLALRFADPYNVRDFGAVADGVTNDRAAIQAAIDAAFAAGGGEVYIPPSTYGLNPATALVPRSGVTVRGAGPTSLLKVLGTTGNYTAIFYSTSLVTDFALRDLAIDQNASGNTSADIANGVGFCQVCLYLTNFRRIEVTGCRLDYCGFNGLFLSGPSTPGSGQYAEDVLVSGNILVAHRGSSSTLNYDMSAIYTEAIRTRVADNSLHADPGDLVNGAIEVHGPEGAVADNTIEGYSVGTYIVQGFNPGQTAPDRNVTVVDNTITGAEAAIQVTTTGGNALRGVTITGNAISLAQLSRNTPLALGIGLLGAATAGNAISGVAITGNTIRFEAGDTRTTARGGASLNLQSGIALAPQCPLSDVTVTDNTIAGPPGAGLRIGDPSASVSGLVASDNVLTDCGSNPNYTDMYRTAILLRGSLSGVRVTDNAVRDTGTSVLNGKYLLNSDATLTDCQVALNTPHTTSGLALATSVTGTPLPVLQCEVGVHVSGAVTIDGTLSTSAGLFTVNSSGGTNAQDTCAVVTTSPFASAFVFRGSTDTGIRFTYTSAGDYLIGPGNGTFDLILSRISTGLFGPTTGAFGGHGSVPAGGTSGQVLAKASGTDYDLAWTAAGGSGTVTSVGLSLPAIFTVSGSPVTGSGTLAGTLATQAANLVWAGPTTGAAAAPTFRALVAADVPDLSGTYSVKAGNTSLVTVGTVATGTWQATKVGLAYGGTNADLSATGAGYLKQATTGASVTVGTIAAGDVPDLSATYTPTAWRANGRLTADVTTTSSTQGTNALTGLSFAIGANEVWSVEFNLTCTGSTAGMKFQLTGPATPASVRVTTQGNSTAVTAYTLDTQTALATPGSAYINNATPFTGVVSITATVANGATAGTVALTFAAATSTQTNKVLQNSYMTARRIS